MLVCPLVLVDQSAQDSPPLDSRRREVGGGGHGGCRSGSGEAPEPEPNWLLADEPVRDSSFIGLFNGAPDLSERSEEILREEFAKSADTVADTGPLG